MGGGGGRDIYTYHYTVTTIMTPALRWAAMRDFLFFLFFFFLPLWSACVIYRYYLCVYFEFVSLT